VRAFDAADAAIVKGDVRMASVLVRAAAATIKHPVDDLDIPTSWGRVRIAASDVNAAIDEISARDVPHNVGRNAVRTQLVRMAEQYIVERRNEDAVPLGFADGLRASKQFQSALSLWPAVSAPRAGAAAAVVADCASQRGRRPADRTRAVVAVAQGHAARRRRAVDRRRSRARRRGRSDRRRRGGGHTGTSSSTRRRISLPWSCARWRGAALVGP